MSRILTLVLAALFGAAGVASTAQKDRRGDPKGGKPALVLHYTFAEQGKNVVKDHALTRHDSRIVKGKLIKTDDGPAVEFAGEGYIAVTRAAVLNPAGRPLVVGAWVYPGAPRGVVAALGGEEHGFSLYLKDGVPTFALRVDGRLVLAQAARRIANGRWSHLMGVLDADGRARVWVDGKPSGNAVNTGHIARNPEDGMSVGADTGAHVGDYRDNGHFTGRLRDLRLYRGVPAETELKKWAKAE